MPTKNRQRHSQQLLAETKVMQLEDTSNAQAHAVWTAACHLVAQNMAVKMLTNITCVIPFPLL